MEKLCTFGRCTEHAVVYLYFGEYAPPGQRARTLRLAYCDPHAQIVRETFRVQEEKPIWNVERLTA